MELWLEEVICGYCPCKFLSLTMELWLEEIFCATNFYCNIFLKYMYKELVPIENLGRWIGPRRINGPLSECPLSASAIYLIKSVIFWFNMIWILKSLKNGNFIQSCLYILTKQVKCYSHFRPLVSTITTNISL